MVKISAFIIARNEEARIEGALRSLVSFCDQIVVVDTGSTDRTKEIALNYTEEIYDFEWIDDFSAARNFALSKCSGDWIVWLDADDMINLQNQNSIKNVINGSPDDVLGFFVNYIYAKGNGLLLPRIFRNGLGLLFRMPVHEYLDIPTDIRNKFAVRSDILIDHRKTSEDNKRTNERNIRILEKATEKSDDAHLRFFLGRDYYNVGKYEGAIKVFRTLLDDPKIEDDSFKYNTAFHLGLTYEKLKEADLAIKYFMLARESDGRFADPLIHMADIFLYQKKDVAIAGKYYQEAMKIPMPKTTLPFNPDFYHGYPSKQLAKLKNLAKPVALVCGYYGIPNIGDELMLESLMQKMRDYRIIAASYNPSNVIKIHGIESVSYGHEYFDQVLEIAEVVVVGGGTLFHDQGLTENKVIEHYCGIIDRANAAGKEIRVVGVGVDEIKLPENKVLIKESFAKCKSVDVRDQKSAENLLACGVDRQNISISHDLVMDLNVKDLLNHSNGNVSNNRQKIGINLCPPIMGNEKDYVRKINHELVPFIKLNRDKMDFVFISGHPEDKKMHQYLSEKTGVDLNLFHPVVGNDYINSYVKEIKSCDYLIAARYHLLLLGKILDGKVFGISYAEKTDSLMRQMGIAVWEGGPTLDVGSTSNVG